MPTLSRCRPCPFPARLPAAASFRNCHPFRALASALSVLLAATLVALLTSCVAADPARRRTHRLPGRAPKPHQPTKPHRSRTPTAPTPTGEYVDDPLSGHSYNLDDYTAAHRQVDHPASPNLPCSPRASQPASSRPSKNASPTIRLSSFPGRPSAPTAAPCATPPRARPATPTCAISTRPPSSKCDPSPARRTSSNTSTPPSIPASSNTGDQDDEARRFTFRIRRGLKWSDGTPVTTEDVRFCIEDIVSPPLSPAIMQS